MPLAEISGALGAERLEARAPRVMYPSQESDPDVELSEQTQSLEGASVDIETTIGEHPATCKLDLDAEGGLDGIFCEVDAGSDNSEFYAQLRESLIQKYGQPRHYERQEQRWSSEAATLECIHDAPVIHFNNYSTRNAERTDAAILLANAKLERANAAAKALREEAARKEADRQAAKRRKLDRDISPAAER